MNVLKNIVPDDVARTVQAAYLSADFDIISQQRKTQFERQFTSTDPRMPQATELYQSKFGVSNYLVSTDLIQNTYKNYIKPALEQQVGYTLTRADLRCYMMPEGCHYRLHTDAYVADVGFVWYLNTNWRWDWGGLLMSLDQQGNAQAEIPEFNKLVVINHKDGGDPHWVTPVTPWALEPRLTLVGFLK